MVLLRRIVKFKVMLAGSLELSRGFGKLELVVSFCM